MNARVFTLREKSALKLVPVLKSSRILSLVPPRLARAQTRAWGERADGSVPGRQRYRRAWGSLPAVIGPPWRGVAVQLPLECEMHGRMVGSRLERTQTSFQVASARECRFGRRSEHEQDLALSRGGEGCIRIENDKSERPRRPLFDCHRRLPSGEPAAYGVGCVSRIQPSRRKS